VIDLAARLTTRPLTSADAPTYRALRRHVLAIGDGRFFADSYTREAALDKTQWREWCAEKQGHCIIGTFDRRALIGVVMITQYGPAADRTVEWEAAWLDPRYRRQGVTQRVYQQVEQWTKDHGYRFVRVFIRDDNTRWQDIRLRQGFACTHTTPDIRWADGTLAAAKAYARDLTIPVPKRETMPARPSFAGAKARATSTLSR
jgi:GNAT superfamily N-acetyltransferase